MAGNTEQLIKLEEKQKGEQIPFIKQLQSHAILSWQKKKKTTLKVNSSTVIWKTLKNKNRTQKTWGPPEQRFQTLALFLTKQAIKQTNQDSTMV